MSEEKRLPAIKTEALTKRHGDIAAVNALELEVYEGELFAFLGENGVGKTTLLKLLSGLVSPDSGDAVLMGKSVVSEPSEVKRLIAVSPRETAVSGRLSPRENLELMARLYGCKKKEAAEKADEMLGRFSLAEISGSRAGDLSGGMQRRLSVAMALISRPKILFLDEPTNGLDFIARRELWSALDTFRGEATIVYTTQSVKEAGEHSDRIGIMADGKLRACGSAEELIGQTGKKSLGRAYAELASVFGKGSAADD